MSDIADLRQSYEKGELSLENTAEDPLLQFRAWFEDALEADVAEPNAMTLATAAPDGAPSARVVLLKGLDDRGFTFYSNYESRKGRDINQNPNVALVFWWEPLERSVRIEGTAERLPDEESTEYFHSRPRGSQLGAWASPQSRTIEERDVLHDNLDALKEKYGDDEDIPRPPHWGGYVVRPEQIEFWQGRPSRLHDRIRYRTSDGDWTRERLAP